MNGNLKSLDNSADATGKHKDVMMLQRKIALYLITTSAKTRQAYDLWSYLILQANGDYNVTVQNLSMALHAGTAVVSQALNYLESIELLKVEEDKQLTGENSRITAKNKQVPNTSKRYTVYYTSAKIIKLMSTCQQENNTVCVAEQPTAKIVIPQPVQENHHTQQQEQYSTKSTSKAAAIEARKEHIIQIGKSKGVYNAKKQSMLLQSVQRFKSETKRSAQDYEIEHIAGLLDGIDFKDAKTMIYANQDINTYINGKRLAAR